MFFFLPKGKVGAIGKRIAWEKEEEEASAKGA